MVSPPPIIMDITVAEIRDHAPIPSRYARCTNSHDQSQAGDNIRPSLHWSGAPPETRSFAIIMVDKDVPTRFESANQTGKVISASLPRRNFYHWVQIDIPANTNGLPEGPGGKVRSGISGQNDFGADGVAGGSGYDGPCPPWNDEKLHHYYFQVYALDVLTLDLPDVFIAQDVEHAMQGHILAKGESVGTYTTNSALQNRQ